MYQAAYGVRLRAPFLYLPTISMISSRYAQSKKKRIIPRLFSRKKLAPWQRGGQLVPVNSLETYVYVNLTVSGSTVTVNNVTSPLVVPITTSTPGSIILTIDPSLISLKDYTLFGYDGTSWKEIPRQNIDAGGNSVALYGNVPGMVVRKQSGAIGKAASTEVTIPVPATSLGNALQFVNISSSIFGFSLQSSAGTYNSNVYIQLKFSANYTTAGTKISGWVPSRIPGLALWLNASEPGSNTFTPNTGVQMLNWTDKSGQGNHASAIASSAPIYKSLSGGVGMGMYFNGSSFFSGNIANTGTYSYSFVVARPDPENAGGGRLLSLGVSGENDSTSNKYTGISATSSGKTTPSVPILVIGMSKFGNPIMYSQNGGITWTPATVTWPSSGGTAGACQCIAYNGNMFVATGHDGLNGVIFNSYNGINWTQVHPSPGQDSGFFYRASVGGGIPVVAYVNSMWICAGQAFWSQMISAGVPQVMHSYDGKNWQINSSMATLLQPVPTNNYGDMFRAISTDGNLIILSGFVGTYYSYDGLNWKNMPSGFYTQTQIINTPLFSGAHVVRYHPGYNVWILGGDGGTPISSTPVDISNKKKMMFSVDGFNWNFIGDNTQIINYNVPSWKNGKIDVTRIFAINNYNGNPLWVLSGPPPFGGDFNGNASLWSKPDTSAQYGQFGFVLLNGYGLTNSSAETMELSAAINFDRTTQVIGYIVSNILTVISVVSGTIDYNNYTLQTPVSGIIQSLSSGTKDAAGSTYNINNSQTVGSSVAPVLITMSYTTMIYGLQQATGSNSYLVVGGTANASVNAPVNVIIDNTNPNPNFSAKMYANSKTPAITALDKAPTKPSIIASWSDGTNACISVNGTMVPLNTLSASKFNISAYAIGKNLGNSSNNYTGYVYEVINYNGNLFTIARRVIEGYLAWKWSIQSLLPASHPFYTRPPSINSATMPWPKIFSGFQPVLWLDGQDPYGNEAFSPPDRTLINTWYDKSGNGNNLVAPSGSEPMFRTNVVSGGAIHFNRYAYQSMGLVKLTTGTDNLQYSNTAQPTTYGTPSPWVANPWVSGCMAAGASSSTADAYGFMYITYNIPDYMGAISGGQIIQYDEVNNQSRMLYYMSYFQGGRPAYFIRGVVIGPITGSIYISSAQYWTAVVPNMLLYVLTPNSLPITANTTYTVSAPRMLKPDGVSFASGGIGWDTLTVDNNETIYLIPTIGNAYAQSIYRFSYKQFTPTSWVSNLEYGIGFITGAAWWSSYSPKDNSISFSVCAWLRVVLYLDNCVTFYGSVGGTTLTVTNVVEGTFKVGNMFLRPGIPEREQCIYTITAFGSGTGGVGTYTVSSISYYNGVQNSTKYDFASALVSTVYPQLGTTNAANSFSPDGLLNASQVYDPVTNGQMKAIYTNGGGYIFSNDTVGKYLWYADAVQGAYTGGGSGARVRRIDLYTRQSTTVYGAINNITTGGTVSNIIPYPIVREKFPVAYEVNGQYDTGGLVSNSVLFSNTAAYIMTSSNTITKLTNPRATSSCMSAPVSISSPAISFFIVYINTNLSKNIMPHGASFLTPMISMSSTTDYVSFVGRIDGTILTVTSITSSYTVGAANPIQLGATISTPLGGFIFSYGPATTTPSVAAATETNPLGTYTISIPQFVSANTTITASNGIDRTNNTVSGSNGASLGRDASTNSFVSVYANNTNVNVYRGSSTTSVASTAAAASWPASGLPNICMGYIAGTVFTVTSVTSGAVIIGNFLNTTAGGTIQSFTSGTLASTNAISNGNIGTYVVSVSQMVGSESKPVSFTLTGAPILPDMLFYCSKSGWTGSKLNGAAATVTNTSTYADNINISAISLGLQPNNIGRKDWLIPNYFFDGSICEVIVYTNDLSTDTYRVAAMEGYLAWKWGIQSKLPAAHMYKYMPPLDYVQTVPSPITSSSFTNLTDTGFTLYWSGGLGGTVFTYVIKQGGTTVTTATIIDNGPFGSNIVIDGLVFNTGYTVTITPYSTLTVGTAYTTPVIKTQNWPSPITDVTITNRPSTTFTAGFIVSWSGGIVSASYTYSFSPAPPTGYVLVDNGLSARNIVVSGMAQNTAYTVTITARAPGGNQVSGSATFTTKGWTWGQYIGGASSVTAAGLLPTQSPAPGDGNGPNAKFARIFSMAIDRSNNIYFTENNGIGRVRLVTPTGIVYTIPVSIDMDCNTSAQNYYTPVAVDKTTGIIYVYNYINLCIYKLTPSTYPIVFGDSNTITTTWTASIFVGPAAKTPTITLTLGSFNQSITSNSMSCAFMACDNSGNLYFRSDATTITKIKIPGNTVSTITPQNSYTYSNGRPVCITFDASNNMYIAVLANGGGVGNCIFVIAPDGTTTRIASGTCCSSGDGTYATGQLYAPTIITCNKNGTIIEYDANTGSLKIIGEGKIVTLARGTKIPSALMPALDGNTFSGILNGGAVADSEGTFYLSVNSGTYTGIIKFWLV